VAIPATWANVSDGLRDRLRGRYESGIGVSVVQIRRRDKTVPKSTLNTKNLEALGAERLAELLIELSQGNAAAKRRLRMELAGTRGADSLAKEVRNRLTTMGGRAHLWTGRV
jgi:regulator of protease activity HflC (stomatin/prohibitin superfamily)